MHVVPYCYLWTLQGVKHAVQNDMFLAEAFEERRRGPFERLGEVGRVLRRYQQQPELHTLNLSHCIRSIDQVRAPVLGYVLGSSYLLWKLFLLTPPWSIPKVRALCHVPLPLASLSLEATFDRFDCLLV
jgi:hypothetical protein